MKKEPFKCGNCNVIFITKESNKDWRAYQNCEKTDSNAVFAMLIS